jgi:cadmium resistance protein CadD (predicted permease)
LNKPLLKWIFQRFVFMLALVLNPSSLFAIIPLFIFSLEKELKNPRFWIGNFIGAIPVFLADHFANVFYKNHPGNILHHLPEDALQFTWKNLGSGLAHLDLHFEGLFPFWWKNGSLILLLFVIPAGIFLYQKRRIYFWSAIITLIVLVFSLGLNKIHDGGHSVFYAASRLYLVLPFVAALFIAFAVKDRINGKFIPELLIVAVIFIGIKVAVLPDQANYSSIHRFDEFAPVEELPLDSVQHDCARLYRLAKETKADLVAGLNYDGFSMEQLWFHAGSVWYDDFPPTVIPPYERRTWRLQEEDTAVRKTILFIGGDEGWWDVRMKNDTNIRVYNSGIPLHLLKNNSKPLIPLMADWGFVVRKHN